MEFEYDRQGRRIGKQVYDPRTEETLLPNLRFLYDGWNLMGELDGSNNRMRTYTWGTDLSGSMQGAGGVGGLLKVTYYGAQTTNAFAAYDGNGNLTALVDTGSDDFLARYEYGSFGEGIRANRRAYEPKALPRESEPRRIPGRDLSCHESCQPGRFPSLNRFESVGPQAFPKDSKRPRIITNTAFQSVRRSSKKPLGKRRSCACEGVHTAGWKSPSGGTFTRL